MYKLYKYVIQLSHTITRVSVTAKFLFMSNTFKTCMSLSYTRLSYYAMWWFPTTTGETTNTKQYDDLGTLTFVEAGRMKSAWIEPRVTNWTWLKQCILKKPFVLWDCNNQLIYGGKKDEHAPSVSSKRLKLISPIFRQLKSDPGI